MDGFKKRSGLSKEAKIAAIADYIRKTLLPNRDYFQPEYRDMLTKHRSSGREVPIGNFAEVRSGVCRENAMIMHMALKRAGIPSRYVYLSTATDGWVEDHALVVVKYQGKTGDR